MTHRPYPNPTRARRQLDRHDDETPPLPDGSSQSAPLGMLRIVVSDEAREAMGVRLAEVGATMRAAFQPRPSAIGETTG
jgi:hypothetical protein